MSSSSSPLQWNNTIDDTSPLFTFNPYSDGSGPQNGWQTWYTVSGYNSRPGDVPAGDSSHVTSLPGASVSLQFFGTGVVLFGKTNCTYDVILDNNENRDVKPVQGALFSASGLNAGAHNITLVARPSSETQQFLFDRAIVTSSTDASPASFGSMTINSQNATAFSYKGEWQSKSDDNVPTSRNPVPFQQTTAQGSSVSYTFSGRAIAVNGPTSLGSGTYSVKLDDKETTFNASSSWSVPDTMLFYQDGLDESRQHTINITNTGANGSPLSLGSVTVYGRGYSNNLSGGSQSSGRSTVGTIVGPVLAVMIVTSVAFLFWWSKRRERRKNRELPSASPALWNYSQKKDPRALAPYVYDLELSRTNSQSSRSSGEDSRSGHGRGQSVVFQRDKEGRLRPAVYEQSVDVAGFPFQAQPRPAPPRPPRRDSAPVLPRSSEDTLADPSQPRNLKVNSPTSSSRRSSRSSNNDPPPYDTKRF